jgi:hypothetical protein
MLLESSPIPFRPEILSEGGELTEEVQIQGCSEATRPLNEGAGHFPALR